MFSETAGKTDRNIELDRWTDSKRSNKRERGGGERKFAFYLHSLYILSLSFACLNKVVLHTVECYFKYMSSSLILITL